MSRFLVLDSAPLGVLTHPQRNAEVAAVTDRLAQCLLSGHHITVPAIIHYEVRRELLRANKNVGVARLDAFSAQTPGRYLPLSDNALRLAAELWATARQRGRPTADVKDLDVDVILAAQALSFGPGSSNVTVVTTNLRHLSQFIVAKKWERDRSVERGACGLSHQFTRSTFITSSHRLKLRRAPAADSVPVRSQDRGTESVEERLLNPPRCVFRFVPGSGGRARRAAAYARSSVVCPEKAVELITGFDAEKLVAILFSQKRLPCAARQVPAAPGAQPSGDFVRYVNGQRHGFVFRLIRLVRISQMRRRGRLGAAGGEFGVVVRGLVSGDFRARINALW